MIFTQQSNHHHHHHHHKIVNYSKIQSVKSPQIINKPNSRLGLGEEGHSWVIKELGQKHKVIHQFTHKHS